MGCASSKFQVEGTTVDSDHALPKPSAGGSLPPVPKPEPLSCLAYQTPTQQRSLSIPTPPLQEPEAPTNPAWVPSGPKPQNSSTSSSSSASESAPLLALSCPSCSNNYASITSTNTGSRPGQPSRRISPTVSVSSSASDGSCVRPEWDFDGDDEEKPPPVWVNESGLGAPINQWGRSRVYRAHWGQRQVAIKVTDHIVTEQQVESRMAEVTRQAEQSLSLQHPHLVRVLHTSAGCPLDPLDEEDDETCGPPLISEVLDGECKEEFEEMEAAPDLSGWSKKHIQVWMVSEYCNRGTLEKAITSGWLQRRRALGAPPNLRHVMQTAWEVASALGHLHSKGIVHGNLDGSRVLLCSTRCNGTRRFVAKLLATGLISPAVDSWDAHQLMRDGVLTHSAPEVISRGQYPILASDVYALGVLMWEMYQGELAWAGRKPSELVRDLVVNRLTLPRLPSCPPEFQALVDSCLDPNPNTRATCPQVMARLEAMLGNNTHCCVWGEQPDTD